LFSRYKSREDRAYDRAYKILRDLQDRKSRLQPRPPETEDPKLTGPETQVPPAVEPEPTRKPTSEIRNPTPGIRNPKSSPEARTRNIRFQNEPTARSRRRFQMRHTLLRRRSAALCRVITAQKLLPRRSQSLPSSLPNCPSSGGTSRR